MEASTNPVTSNDDVTLKEIDGKFFAIATRHGIVAKIRVARHFWKLAPSEQEHALRLIARDLKKQLDRKVMMAKAQQKSVARMIHEK